jgi:quercetin dioxygenase-like cupin family protein
VKRIERILTGLPVAPIYWALQEHPELWNQQRARTEDPRSPHHGLDDIWARYGDPDRAKDGQAHDAFWYPAADTLGIKGMCLDLMRALEGVELGGVLITRIPPGKQVKPHIDPGWHARRYEKYGVQITSAPGQKFCFDGEELETRPGDVFWFDNAHTHWVTNPTNYERVTMIVCVRKET